MTALNKYLLHEAEVLVYLKDNLQGVNLLSSSVCKYVTFEDGFFYTFLPKGLTEKQLYGFQYGGLGGNIRTKVINILSYHLQNDSELICIFDDVDGTYNPSYNEPSFLKSGVHFKDQIYYLVNAENFSRAFLKECLQTSNAFWHSLCVVSRIKFFRPEDRSIKEAEMIEFGKKAKLILLGAYDGEGYIIWEKNT